MQKLIRGIIDFREHRREGYTDTFSKLALGQKPDALFIACSDSRVAVNVFASDDPGDLFVLRNVGNLVPPHHHAGSIGTAAAIDFAVDSLRVLDIGVCGHSDCGAMHALVKGPAALPDGALRSWLEMAALEHGAGLDVNEASRRNVLAQLEHLRGYPSIARAVMDRGLRLHAFWFDIRNLDVFYWEAGEGQWTLLDRAEGERILLGFHERSNSG